MPKQNTAKPSKSKKLKVTLVVIVSLLALLLMYDLSPLGGNLRFYTKWASCGQWPVEGRTSFDGRGKYYDDAEGFSMIRFGQPVYFCSSAEAEHAGYEPEGSFLYNGE